MSTHRKVFLLGILLYLLNISPTQAQVTMGLSEPPITGAILQLKNIPGVTGGGANANRGLLLPRVKLEKVDDLSCIRTSANEDPLQYIGLLIYNADRVENEWGVLPAGIYSWTGATWELLSEGNIEIKNKNPFKADLEALQRIKEANPNNTLPWSINLGTETYNGNGLKFTEINGYKRLTELHVSNSNLSVLDVSQFTELEELNCSENKLEALSLNNQQHLETLDCSNNALTQLDLGNNKSLKLLNHQNNKIEIQSTLPRALK